METAPRKINNIAAKKKGTDTMKLNGVFIYNLYMVYEQKYICVFLYGQLGTNRLYEAILLEDVDMSIVVAVQNVRHFYLFDDNKNR